MCFLWYDKLSVNYTNIYYSSKQGRFSVFISDRINISDPVVTFDHSIEIEIKKYLKNNVITNIGRKGYNSVNMLKTILFGFMDKEYISLRELEDECKVNIRYMYLMDYATAAYKIFGKFINKNLTESIEDIFKGMTAYIVKKEDVNLSRLYIDGPKNVKNNKYGRQEEIYM